MTGARTAVRERRTGETTVRVEATLGRGTADVRTTVPFLDHMMTVLAKYSGIDLIIRAEGDLRHHIIEDVALTVGPAIAAALPATTARYGERLVPMDEALCQVAMDLGGRPYLVYSLATKKRKIRDFDVDLMEEFFRGFVTQGRMNLHIHQQYGQEPHHALEAVFKGVAKALLAATARNPRIKGVLSSKGTL